MAESSYLLSTVFPFVGVFLSNGLYFAPAPAVLAAVHSGSIGTLNAMPHAVMAISTIAWVGYSLSVPNLYIALANIPGAVGAVWYVVSLLPIIPRDRASERLAVQAVVVVGAMITMVIWLAIIVYELSPEKRSFVLGLYGSILCIILFASPLSTVREVLSTRSSASIYAPLTVAQCINCGTWTLYGFAVGDLWVWGPNGTGFLLGLIQVLLKLCFPSRRPGTEDMSPIRVVGVGDKHVYSDEEDMRPTSGLIGR